VKRFVATTRLVELPLLEVTDHLMRPLQAKNAFKTQLRCVV
jgi:hypothetical protein